ncbi:hypothetical protein [Paractinoplanes durhamensis]|uniref:hypothetical protein n=1 Tax=Paractinoplanes durhamensis TaxID=113563 RepID=UPI00363B9EF4
MQGVEQQDGLGRDPSAPAAATKTCSRRRFRRRQASIISEYAKTSGSATAPRRVSATTRAMVALVSSVASSQSPHIRNADRRRCGRRLVTKSRKPSSSPGIAPL